MPESGNPVAATLQPPKGIRLRLPATSANLGPGFDTLGLALDLYLEVEATPSAQMHLHATGQNAEVAGSLHGNLMLETYRSLAPLGPPLSLQVHNGIPLGMGCGSSAAALLAGVHLANHFAAHGWSQQQILEEACRREGHPDNVAACHLGGLTASAMENGRVTTATFGMAGSVASGWRYLLALPQASLATSEARALLPGQYSRADTVANLQSTSLLISAFALGRPDLLAMGTKDRLHQPYRMVACPLLPRLLPLAGSSGIYSVTLSGAGPSVLLICAPDASPGELKAAILAAAGDLQPRILDARLSGPAETLPLND